jgi:methylaspartate ammonia-lyase
MDYVSWLSGRIRKLRSRRATTGIALDVYGTIGLLFGNENYGAMALYLEKLAQAAETLPSAHRGPDGCGRAGAADAVCGSSARRWTSRLPVELVADEWCNTLEDVKYFADNKAGHMLQIKTPGPGRHPETAEAVLYCREKGIVPIRAAPATRPTAPSRCAYTWRWRQSPTRSSPSRQGVDEGHMTSIMRCGAFWRCAGGAHEEEFRILSTTAILGYGFRWPPSRRA